jgi:tyrosyl-tRNA synthetase
MNVNRCLAAGGTFVFWVADWFALMNDKMGGDLAKIRDVGNYLVEVWRAAGMRMDRVEFRWASDEICRRGDVYWP